MPTKRKPSYLLHKPTGQARVRIDGKDIYLGEYGTPESRDRYDDLMTEWFARQGRAIARCWVVWYDGATAMRSLAGGR